MWLWEILLQGCVLSRYMYNSYIDEKVFKYSIPKYSAYNNFISYII